MQRTEPCASKLAPVSAADAAARWGTEMKTILTICFLAATAAMSFAEEASVSTNVTAVLTSRNFRYVEASVTQKEVLDDAMGRLALVKQTKAQTRTIDAALLYLWETVNIAVIQTHRTCTEYKGYFWFSRLDTANPDDQTFRSGFAVKKGTGDIYRWEERKPQQSAALPSAPQTGPSEGAR